MLVNNTPIQIHQLGGRPILVKREDLCCPPPGPSFSKMRGVLSHVAAQEASIIGVLDTSHSKAGWAVAWACQQLDKQCVNFWPRYKADPPGLPRVQQQIAQGMGAEMVAIKAGRSAILFHAAKKYLKEHYPGTSYMMPNALKLNESVGETAQEVLRTKLPPVGTLVVSISSGTIAAGVLQGFHEAGLLPGYQVILHMGYSRSPDACYQYICDKAGLEFSESNPIKFIDEGYDYAKGVEADAPFPTNPYYDGKAWKWLAGHIGEIEDGPIVFWNIGD